MEVDLNSLRVHSLESMGTQDGPGLRLVVFTQGCEFRCLYCHNPDTFSLKGGYELPLIEIENRMERMRPYFKQGGGITVSGGEPLLQRNRVRKLFEDLHERGFQTCLDTNGRLLNDEVKNLLDETDLVLLDIKHMDIDRHRKLTGLGNEQTLAFAAYRESTNKPMWLRHVLVPGWTDSEEHLKSLGAHFKNYQSVERLEILPYHTLGAHKYEAMGLDYALKDLNPPSEESKNRALEILKPYFKEVILK